MYCFMFCKNRLTKLSKNFPKSNTNAQKNKGYSTRKLSGPQKCDSCRGDYSISDMLR